MRRNAHVRFGGRAEETDGWKRPHGAPARPYTYVPTREGWVYVSFLQDGFSRRILGFVAATSKTTQLVTRTLLQAVNVRQRSSASFVANGLIVHSDAGSQYTSLAFTEKLLDLGLAPSIGRVGTAYDNALIESTIGSYKTELVHRRARGWDGREDIEMATARWVAWFNRQRLHEHLGYSTPTEIEEAYIHQQGLPRQAA